MAYFRERLPQVIPGSEARLYYAGALYTIPEAFEAMRQNLPKTTEAFTPPFAAAVEVPSAAPLIERLVAWNGRNPSWPG